MTERKKAWVKPGLIVLVRNKQKESVLTLCKSTNSKGLWADLNYCDEQGWGGCTEISPS